jgi:maleylacetoacetate isomerase
MASEPLAFTDETTPLLHTYFRSSCSARIRIACSLKNIPLQYVFVHLLKNEQRSDAYNAINPSNTVPTLTITGRDGKPIIIRQSIAILEFLEEYYPDRMPLLPPPSDPVARARVRELVNIISIDIQQLTNISTMQRVKRIGAAGSGSDGQDVWLQWANEITSKGLKAYETLAAQYAGKYSYGDSITLADVVLAPAMEAAVRWGVDAKQFPTVLRIWEAIRKEHAFVRADWRHQPDTPNDFRER